MCELYRQAHVIVCPVRAHLDRDASQSKLLISGGDSLLLQDNELINARLALLRLINQLKRATVE